LSSGDEIIRGELYDRFGDKLFTDFDTIRRHCRKSLARFIDERTRRRPAVIPVVMEV